MAIPERGQIYLNVANQNLLSLTSANQDQLPKI